jgi:acyl-[acyl-carrier-protein]-phospholipid O-acyltransferase/long-chain-fatty-acid--[acyl-carrier-protein] ligase
MTNEKKTPELPPAPAAPAASNKTAAANDKTPAAPAASDKTPAAPDEASVPQAETPSAPKRTWLGRQLGRGLRHGLRAGFRLFYGAKFSGLENFKGLQGKPTLIVANHTSFIDGFLLAAALPIDASFAIDTGMYNKIMKNPFGGFAPWLRAVLAPLKPVVRFAMNRMDFHPMDTTKPQAIRALTRLAKAGQPVMIFPEGRLTATGTIMQVFGGSATVADHADANIVAIHMDGLNFLPWGITRLKNFPKRTFPKLSVTVLPPVKLDIPEDLAGKARRAAADAALEKIMLELPVKALDKNRTVMDALHLAAHNFGRKYEILDDATDDVALTYGKLMIGAYALGDKLAKLTPPKTDKDGKPKENYVGFLLPNSKAAAAAFFGLQAYGRVPTMLNAKAEKADMISFTETAELKEIVTSRRFVELAKLEDKVKLLAEKCKIIYLEDVKPTIGAGAKVKALAHANGWLPRPKTARKGGDPACVIFTSGSEGPPKGVVLSSANLLSNIAQVHAVTPIMPSDKVFNCMPIFHSFGLSGGLIMPVVNGVRSFQYPNPLDSKNIPKLVYFYDTTIMFGTDTFLNLYARNATDKDFSGLRMVFAGAERLKDETYDRFVDRFGVRVNNAYGLTEASPGVAMNVPGAHERGTVGRPLPGVELKFEPVADMPECFELSVKGPNVMLGYLKHDLPGVIQPPPGGWHATGDIVGVTAKNSLKIVSRSSRIAKPGGEKVALDDIEAVANAASKMKDVVNATICKLDPDDGDTIVLFTTDKDLKADALARAAKEIGVSQLGMPKNKDIHVLPEIPKLPTGKNNYTALKKLLAEIEAAGAKPAADAKPVSGIKPAAPGFNAASGPANDDTPPAAEKKIENGAAPKPPRPGQ